MKSIEQWIQNNPGKTVAAAIVLAAFSESIVEAIAGWLFL